MEAFATFEKEFQEKESVEEKIRYALLCMRKALSEVEPPQFKCFWEFRKRVLPLFKEIKSIAKKKPLWEEFIALGHEAKQLKKLAEEKADFVVEQIVLAVEAIEKDLKEMPLQLEQIHVPDFPNINHIRAEKREEYVSLYKEAHLLGVFAERLQALRGEVLSLEMRFRQKNQLLDRIRHVGDMVFPRKKKIIEQISKAFINDVMSCAQAAVSLQTVKDFQQMAKLLPLHSTAYRKSAALLKGCWERALAEEKRGIREKKIHEEKSKVADSLAQAIRSLLEEDLSLEVLMNKRDELYEHLQSVCIKDIERESLEALFRRVKDKIEEKKALDLLREESGDVRERLEKLLEEREGRRKEIKEQMQAYRKRLGGSNLDMESAMIYRDLLEEEREALEKVEESMDTLESELEKYR